MQAFSHQYPLAASFRSENLKNFATSFASVVDTGGKFATVVNDTGGNLPPLSLTPVANNGNNIRLLRP